MVTRGEEEEMEEGEQRWCVSHASSRKWAWNQILQHHFLSNVHRLLVAGNSSPLFSPIAHGRVITTSFHPILFCTFSLTPKNNLEIMAGRHHASLTIWVLLALLSPVFLASSVNAAIIYVRKSLCHFLELSSNVDSIPSMINLYRNVKNVDGLLGPL